MLFLSSSFLGGFFVRYLVHLNFLTQVMHTVSVVALDLCDGYFLFLWKPD